MSTDFNKFKRKQYVARASMASYWTIIGTVLPFIIGTIILLTFGFSSKMIGFIDRGDFCLYSAGLLSTSLFLLTDNKDTYKEWFNVALHPIVYLLIIIAASLYSAIYIAGDLLKEKNIFSIATQFVRMMSIILFVCSIVITYRAFIIDFKNRTPVVDAVKESETQVDDIKNELGI